MLCLEGEKWPSCSSTCDYVSRLDPHWTERVRGKERSSLGQRLGRDKREAEAVETAGEVLKPCDKPQPVDGSGGGWYVSEKQTAMASKRSG